MLIPEFIGVFMKSVSVILPTYNEKENILEVIGSLIKYVKNPLEIIVVDDKSQDGTLEAVKSSKFKNVKIIRRISHRSLPKSISDGILNARGDIIIWMDADMSHPPEIVPKLVKAVEKYDVVIASRYVDNGKDIRPIARRIASRAINHFASFIFGFKIRDWSTGFVAARRRVFGKIKLIDYGYGEYCINFLYSCIKNGFTVKEIGFVNSERTKGHSKTSHSLMAMLGIGYKYIKEVLKLRVYGT